MQLKEKLAKIIAKKDLTQLQVLIDKLLLKAYNIGWNDYLWGDDISSIDNTSEEQILEMIKEDDEPRILNSKWEKSNNKGSVPLPIMLQDEYQDAIRFAGEKHAGQSIPGSPISYMAHISNVAMEVLLSYFKKPSFDINFATQVAILHDVLEDTQCTTQELENKFGQKITDAVQALSKDKCISSHLQIKDSIHRIKKMPKEVGLVKLADRITNLQPPPTTWTKDKIQTYKEESLYILKELGNCNDYLKGRLGICIEIYGE
ncbi:MAG: HD domain-containing protein [Bacteroidales bacterium]